VWLKVLFIYFLHVDIQLLQYHLRKCLSLLLWLPLYFCQNQLFVYLCIHSLSILFLWSTCLSFCQYHTVLTTIDLHISWNQVLSPLVLFIQSCSSIPGLLHLCMNFRTRFSISTEKTVLGYYKNNWILIRLELNLYRSVWRQVTSLQTQQSWVLGRSLTNLPN
jgi:hypothetical protein